MRSRSSSSTSRGGYFGLVTLFLLFATHACSGEYYGKLIGKLSELHHGVSGEVYAVDARTLFIKDFTYDGEGPAAYFYAGNSKTPIDNGFKIRDERGMPEPLRRYRKKGITLTLPEGKTLSNIRWFAVWCDDFSVNFGDVRIPRRFDYPKPQKLAGLNGVHGVSSEPVVIVDAQTLLVPNFSYDGEAPDAKFWVGPGPKPSQQGVRVPDENGKINPLRRYAGKTIVLTLPGDLTVYQLGHFGVWCEAFTVDFGHIQIPSNLNVPPSLKMLGVSPQSKLNCEVLEDNLAFEVRWAVAGDSIVVQLVGKLAAGQYMSFGLSANPERSVMVGGDIVVAWIDKETLQGYAEDYFLDAKSQCSGGRGSCPDVRIQEKTNSIRLLNAAMVNGYSIVTYQRPLAASDELDRQIRTNGSQAIIWAIGPLNERNEVSFHSHYLKTDRLIEFGRPPSWNCPMPDTEPSPSQQEEHSDKVNNNNNNNSNKQELVATTRRPSRVPATPAPAETKDAWEIPPIQCYEPEDGVFYAQMGPTGGIHGYPAITGHVGWGISWYINGLLIPEINVVRGKKYTFVVEGGENSEIPARYHPFYITDDPVGGYQHKTPEEKAKVKIFAGVRKQRGVARPVGIGRLCNWTPDENQPAADEFSSFGAYQRTLSLVCDRGEPGIVEWTPDENTPDTVYYQCFTHRYLGWKINVLDSCDVSPSPSENHEVYLKPPLPIQESADLESAGSIRVSSKVTPSPDFYQGQLEHDHRPINFGNMKHVYPSSPQTAAYSYPRNPTINNQVSPTQVMILRRPGRRPQIIQPEITPQRYMERKKAVYKAPITKLSKIDKQKVKIESKISSDGINENVQPARNTGFNPDSIVIEGGFKPIIRSVDRNDDITRSQDYSASYWETSNEDEKLEEENFEPVYLPQVRSEIKKSKKKIQGLGKIKQRLDDIDDMEMAADGLESYYLPPTGGRVPEERLAPGTLITFDGKRVKDSSLARSISPKGEEQTPTLKSSTGRLSDVLTRTPQFGKFRGELPPPIPGDVRSESLPQLDSRGTTKLTKRTKRSSYEDHKGYEVHENHNSTHEENQESHDFHDGSTLASTGRIIITNLEYVALTIILYFVM